MIQFIPLVALVFLSVPVGDEARIPKSIDTTVIRAIPVQYDGRLQPLDTVARDLVHKITGQMRFQENDPVVVLLAWTFSPATWQQQPLISIDNAELRRELSLPAGQKLYSFFDLVKAERLLSLMDESDNLAEGQKPNPLQSKVRDIKEKLLALQSIFNGQVIKVIPHPKQANGAWAAISTVASLHAPATGNSMREAWEALNKAFTADDAAAFSKASDRLIQEAAALPAVDRPSRELIDIELRFNQLRPFHSAWMILAIGAAFAVVAMLVQRRWFDMLATWPLVAGWAMESYGLWLRWQIAGSIPASNMYESLLFLGWGMAIFAILARFVFAQRLILLTASGMAALALFLADVVPLDPFIRPIVPVLRDTYWMSIHVPVIMVSYSVLALGVLVAHVQLGAMALAPRNRQLAAAIDSLHYWYIHVGSILLAVGIFTGSMWAASAWGRYWGWDPKEVWSLVAFFGYLTILHVRINRERIPGWAYVVAIGLTIAVLAIITPQVWQPSSKATLATWILPIVLLPVALGAMALFTLVKGPFATAIKSIFCFWMVIMTYLGVNYILGTGLHSYGFGTGAMTRTMFLVGGIDLALMAVFSVMYLIRREPMPRVCA